VILQGASRVNVLAVPQVAVLDGPQGKFVYVAGKDKDGKDVAMPRPVVVGDWVGANGSNEWVIESGLKADDRVIVNGVARLMGGGPIKIGAAPAAGAPDATPAAGAPGATPPADPAAAGAASTAKGTKAPAASAPAAPAGNTPPATPSPAGK
jgi:membrane fusion protein, multidrug efflux system